MKTNADKLMCEYSDGVVAYLYQEMPPRETAIFEAHLEHCTTCTDEFAAVADTRYSVYEWHKEEFVPLATPRFVVPSEAVTVSVWQQLAGLFGARPAMAYSGGFAVVMVALALGFVALRQPDLDLAANVEVPAPVAATTITAPPIIEAPLPKVSYTEPQPATVAPALARKPAARLLPETKRPRVKRAETVTADSLRQARKAPVLSDEIYIEDESLRLTDLFEEVGG